MATRVKICGLTRREDAELAVHLGADALGFILEPTSKRFLSEVPDWLAELPVYVSRVAVFGHAPREFLEVPFEAVQAQGWTPCVQAKANRWRIEAVPCGPGMTPERAFDLSRHANAILLDAAVEGHFGGTGVASDWDAAARIVEESSKPVILAGGLTAENVGQAIQRVRPYAVDVSSGVELRPGIKEPEKMKRFFEAVRRADELL